MSMSYVGFGFLSVAVLSLGGLNAYQHTSSKRIEFLMECERERSRINDDQMRDNLVKMITDMREQNIEIARGQGRLDGIVSAINNIKMSDDNEYSRIWHDGYYRGTSQIEQQSESAFEAGYHKATEDGHCSAKPETKIKESSAAFIKGPNKETAVKVEPKKENVIKLEPKKEKLTTEK
jgi:hypothetical protein